MRVPLFPLFRLALLLSVLDALAASRAEAAPRVVYEPPTRCHIGWHMLPGQSNPFPGGVVLTLAPAVPVRVRVVYGDSPLALDTVVGEPAALRGGGELLIVANRHLRYDQVLARRFGKVRRVAAEPKFVVWRARRG